MLVLAAPAAGVAGWLEQRVESKSSLTGAGCHKHLITLRPSTGLKGHWGRERSNCPIIQYYRHLTTESSQVADEAQLMHTHLSAIFSEALEGLRMQTVWTY